MARPEEYSKQGRNWRQNRYFSESFKREKVREIERNIRTVMQVSKEFEVSTTAIYKWLYKYSAHRKKGIKQVIEPMSDAKKIKELEARIRELEQAVGQKQMQLDFTEKMVEIASDMVGYDIKKKHGSQASAGFGRTGKNTPGK